MERQADEVEQYLRQNWQQIRHRILDQFVQVSVTDLDSASSVNDLVRRIADRSHYTEPYVETKLRELVAVASGSAAAPSAQGGGEPGAGGGKEGQPAAEGSEQPAAEASEQAGPRGFGQSTEGPGGQEQ